VHRDALVETVVAAQAVALALLVGVLLRSRSRREPFVRRG
jgi:hypothetical protein